MMLNEFIVSIDVVGITIGVSSKFKERWFKLVVVITALPEIAVSSSSLVQSSSDSSFLDFDFLKV